jgi:hypothetical protein
MVLGCQKGETSKRNIMHGTTVEGLLKVEVESCVEELGAEGLFKAKFEATKSKRGHII